MMSEYEARDHFRRLTRAAKLLGELVNFYAHAGTPHPDAALIVAAAGPAWAAVEQALSRFSVDKPVDNS